MRLTQIAADLAGLAAKMAFRGKESEFSIPVKAHKNEAPISAINSSFEYRSLLLCLASEIPSRFIRDVCPME